MKKKISKRKLDKDGYEYAFDGISGKYVRSLPAVPRPSWVPSPKEVAEMLQNERITIFLEHETVKFFRKKAKKYKVSYQQMIREVLRSYAIGMKMAA